MGFSYAVIGTGAIGGYYGGLLAKAGFDVHFLLHSDYRFVKINGLVIKSQNGDFHLPKIQAFRSAADMPPCDVVLICLKAANNSILKGMLPKLVKPDGVAIVMEDGLGVEDEVADIIGPDRVMGGLCFICSQKIGPGAIHHIDHGSVKLAEYSPDHSPRGITDRMRSIAEDFKKAGVSPVELSPDLQVARWQKLAWNIPIGGLCITMNTTIHRIIRGKSSRNLAESIMHEIIDGATALGHGFPHDFADVMLSAAETMHPFKPSIKLDFDAGKPMEVKYIFANPLRALQKAGFKAPLLNKLYREIRYLMEAKSAVTEQKSIRKRRH